MREIFSSAVWIATSAVMSVVGAVGAILAIYQYVKSSKELREYKYLFKIAGQNAELEDKGNKIKDYDNQIANMKKTMSERLPEEAKKIALKSILENELNALSSAYTKVVALQSELETLTSEETLETAKLMKDVTEVIEPVYSQKRLGSFFTTLFYFISISSTIFLFAVLPETIYRQAAICVLFLQLVIGISSLELNYARKELADITHKIFLGAAIAFWVIYVLFSLLYLYINTDNFIDKSLVSSMASVSFLLHATFGVIYFEKGSNWKLFIWVGLSVLTSLLTSTSVFLLEGICAALADMIFLCICFLTAKNRKAAAANSMQEGKDRPE